MISANLFAAIFRFLEAASPTPRIAVRLWVEVFTLVDESTGEILASRKQLAAAVNARPSEISNTMTLLESVRAISRQREEGRVRYFLNPQLASPPPGGPTAALTLNRMPGQRT